MATVGSPPSDAPRRSVGSALLAVLRPDLRRWVALGALIGVVQVGMLAGPLVVRRVIDLATEGTTSASIVRLAVVYLAIATITRVIAVVVVRFATRTAWLVTNGLRMKIARHVLGLDHEFHRKHTPGELIQRVDGDVTNVSEFLSIVLPKMVGAALLLTGMVGVLFVLDWRIAVGMIVYLAVAGTSIIAMRHRAVGEAAEEMGAYARLYGGIEERLTAIEDLRANGAETHAVWRFVEESTDVLGSSVGRAKAFLRLWWVLHLTAYLGIVVSLVASAVLTDSGAITLGTAFMLFQYVELASRPLGDLIHQLEIMQKANGAMRRVVELLDVQPSILDTGRTSPPAGALAVRFCDVSFHYADDDADDPVLREVDIDIAAGRSVGIVGRTGGGKTTFSRLVLRLVEATGGTVEIGGVPIADIPMAELRRRVAMIPQEVELFEGSVRDNVTMFDPSRDTADVIAALENAGLGRLAASGIDRPLGAGGTGMSAGEAQLLALARIWLRQPDLVVLDEATARIDPQTEAQLAAAIGRLTAGRTTLIIAHRLSTLDLVDDIVVIDHGRIIEQGTRADLVERRGGHFRRLLELSLAGNESDDEQHEVTTAGSAS